jgi:HlyD family secretion protein
LDDAQQSVDDLSASIEAAKHTISVIGSTLAGSEADIARAEDALGNTVILSPMDGIITVLDMEVGEQVLGTFNNIGSRIMTIADLTRMILKAEIAESDIASVEQGQIAKIHINAYPDTTLSGTVTRIALQRSMSSQGAGVFQAEIEIDLQGRALRSGHAANADIEIATHRGLLVESQAIVERLIEDLPDEIRLNAPLIDRSKRTTSVLYRLVEGKSVCTPVRVGPSDLTQTVIVEGLQSGDVVVVGPYKVLEKIEDGEDIQDEREAAVETVDRDEDATDQEATAEGSEGA